MFRSRWIVGLILCVVLLQVPLWATASSGQPDERVVVAFPGNPDLKVIKYPGNEMDKPVEIIGGSHLVLQQSRAASATKVTICELTSHEKVPPFGNSVVGYYADIYCSDSIIGSLEVWLEQTYPGQANWTVIHHTRWAVDCTAGPKGCATGIYSFDSSGCGCSRQIRVMAVWNTSAPMQTVSRGYPMWPYNDRGYAYPVYQAPWGILEFPSSPYSPPRVRESIRADTEQKYLNNKWPFPPNPYDAHHIKPAYFNGLNDGFSNGVLMERSIHQNYFTAWWCKFSTSDAPEPTACDSAD